MVRGVGIVGTGVVFHEHAHALLSLSRQLRLVGVAEIDPYRRRSASDAFFVPFVTADYEELLSRPEVDVVVVCTPPAAHEEIVTAALAAGKDVICEKPLAPNLAAADRIIAAASHQPGRLSTVYQWRYIPEVRRIIHLRDRGRLGRLVLGRFQRFARIPAEHQGKGSWGRWDVFGGGALMTQAIHELDLMVHIFGPVTSVSAEIGTVKVPIESDDTVSATLRFESGAIGVLSASVATHDASTQFDVVGEHASLHFPWRVAAVDPRIRRQLIDEALACQPAPSMLSHPFVKRACNKVGQFVPRLTPTPPPPAHLAYLAAVADALDHDAPLPVSPLDARRSIEVATAIYTSALNRRPVTLPVSDDNPYYAGVSRTDYDGRAHPAGVEVPR